MKDDELAGYMNASIRKLVSNAFRTAVKNPKETAFLLRYAWAAKQSQRRRMRFEREGVHIPPFLISSITVSCNLFCAGCYARANHLCKETQTEKPTAGEMLPDGRWAELFAEANRLGVSFILLAGGEPFLQKNVILQAAKIKNIIFPVFTNGTLLDDGYIRLLDRNRNLLPVISLEGDRERTDARRGTGTYGKADHAMDRMKSRNILYGTSITVTAENLQEVLSEEFIQSLYRKECRIVFFIEYVPVADGTAHLSLDDDARAFLENRKNELEQKCRDMIFVSFPGDEKFTGGCLAAGRGFFHINPYGHAEPCPFSPYSDTSVRTGGLLDALKSPLFAQLKRQDFLDGPHEGGCSLFAHDEQIRAMNAGKSGG